MRDTFRLLALLGAGLASLASAHAPPIDPAARAGVDARAAALQPSMQTYPASAGEPARLAAGQWVAYKQVDHKQQTAFVTLKITDVEDGAYWLEVSEDRYNGHSASRMLLAIGDPRDPSTYVLRAQIAKRRDGSLQTTPQSAIDQANEKHLFVAPAELTTRWSAHDPQEDLGVVAGSFVAAHRGRAVLRIGDPADHPGASGVSVSSIDAITVSGDVWCHAAVPLGGVVRFVGIDRKVTSELVAFGLEGAVSEF